MRDNTLSRGVLRFSGGSTKPSPRRSHPRRSSAAGGEGAGSAAATPSVILRGGATDRDHELSRATRLVLTTYGFSRRGISLPQMTAMIRATPRRTQTTQISGRITRRTSDPAMRSIKRIVVDIVDTECGLAGQISDRREAYRARGWEIRRVTRSHEMYPAGPEDDPQDFPSPPPIGSGSIVTARKRRHATDNADDSAAAAAEGTPAPPSTADLLAALAKTMA